jgi:hypothetical protein
LLIKKESLAEIRDLPANKLIKLVHDVTQDSNSMLANIVDHLLHADRFKLFSLSSPLMEDLGVQVVMVISDVLFCFTQEYHDVDTLFNLLGWKM